jgi:SNF2 family DNA or RNA helicase
MGLGKSVITLTAIFDLCLDSFLIRKVLVIAPLRVARDTWPAEIKKWDHLNGLTYAVAVGTEQERLSALKEKLIYTSSTVKTWTGSSIKAVSLSTTIWWSSMSCPPSNPIRRSGSKAF